MGVFIFILFIGYIFYFLFFSKGQKFKNAELFDIYLSLAITVLKTEKRNSKEKRIHFQKYLIKKFNIKNNEFVYLYRNALSTPRLQLKSAARWFNKNIKDENKRSQILYFLVGIAIIDGKINHKERKLFRQFAQYLKLPESTLHSIIASHEEIYRKKIEKEYAEREKERQKEKRNKPKPTYYRKEKMALILEVDPKADFSIIKKAYRNMVKKHHPDLFQNESQELIIIARERFIEIQEAYEFFEEIERRG